MSSFIVFIVIVLVIIQMSGKSKNKTSGTPNKQGGVIVSSAPAAKSSVSVKRENRPISPQTMPSSGNGGRDTREAYGSTMEMLRKKAEEDQREHDREKRYAEYKQKKEYMGKAYAQRLVPGDSVPKGMYVKCCKYCGAENLLTYGSREQLLCYFCREDL